MTENARVTPWSIVFGDAAMSSHFELIREQEDLHGTVTRESVMHLPAAGALLRELLGSDDDVTQHGELFAQMGALIFHAYRHWRCGRALHRFDPSAFAAALALSVENAIDVPTDAGYIQLPRNALWARVGAGDAPEPVDGFFWSVPARIGTASYLPRIDLLFALGVRRGRPGFSTFDVTVAPADLSQWAKTSARPDGEDFANVLPGGELQGYHALTTRAEAIKLAALCFAHMPSADGIEVAVDEHDVNGVDG
jgi:hypothetical protein